jgi:hypothetical protein
VPINHKDFVISCVKIKAKINVVSDAIMRHVIVFAMCLIRDFFASILNPTIIVRI